MCQRVVNLFASLLVMTIFPSCDFQTVVDADIPVVQPKMVVSSVFTTDSVIYISVSKSLNILDNYDDFSPIENATVMLIIDDSAPVNVPHVQREIYFSEDIKAHGDNYVLQVSAPGFKTVSSSITIPSPVQITKIEPAGRAVMSEGIRAYVFNLYFNDTAERTDFYRVHVEKTGTWFNEWTGKEESYEYRLPIETNDPALSKEFVNDNVLLFKDVVFNGRQAKIPVLIPEEYFQADSGQFYFVLETLNSDLYHYLETKSLQQFIEDDPFAQPVVVHNNITNGFGIFGSYSAHKVEFK